MADGNNRKAIMPQGIVRNQTKIGVQDGQSDDLVNLRFLDGSWRASGNGRQIENFSGTGYTQLYVHTNVYHHLLGVHDGTLYWFAEIGTDGVTFYPLDSTTDRSQWTEGMMDLPTEPVALTTVTGNMWVTQTGHLLTIIDEADDFEHFVFKTSTKEYIEVNMDVNGKPTDRSLYPFGQVHFNCYCPNHGDGYEVKLPTDTIFQTENEAFGWAVEKMKDQNKFCQPFLAIACIKLYDGSYLYASNPSYIHPREAMNNLWLKAEYLYVVPTYEGEITEIIHPGEIVRCSHPTDGTVQQLQNYGGLNDDTPLPFAGIIDVEGLSNLYEDGVTQYAKEDRKYCPQFIGSDLCLSVSSNVIDLLENNKEVFTSLCIFVTEQALTRSTKVSVTNPTEYMSYDEVWAGKTGTALSWASGRKYCAFRKPEYVKRDLLHSPFYLLREYKSTELYDFLSGKIVDITDAEYAGLLKNLVQQKTLDTEALSRTTYLPKVSYMYNGRLHIANYKSHPFFGYPIDLFHLHNHSVKVQDGEWFKGVLPNLADNNDAYLQYPKTQHCFPATYSSAIKYFAYITVDIDTTQGMQRVVRYIEPYEIGSGKDGRADFIENLNPLLTYPDTRAKSMSIRIFKEETTYQGGAIYLDYYKTVELKPHPYLNIAYYIDPDLKPIEFEIYPSPNNHILPEMQNTDEYFPNGLKVSKTDQPMFFPVENTYQIGSAEILALMSNSIAVGTGQTGAAPLYIFCKDGVYALFVDASGQMTYTNSRILARDVCNNARSVTTIDAGVVFTTDRGLMMMSGEQVEEIGAPAEGDVFRIEDYEDAPYDQQHPYVAKKIMWHRFTADAFANLPQGMLDGVDFLTYISGAIINYNHNLRELMVSNEKYPYSYVMDRDGQWSRRSFTADEYVNNYPTSYRVKGGTFYKVDDEGNSETSLEHRKEADNGIFWLSNIIKLESIGFKELHRLVIRGYFETIGREELYLGLYVFGSYDGRQWAMIGGNERQGKFTDIGCKIERADIKFIRVCLAGQVTGKSRIDYIEVAFDPSILNTKIR